MPRNLLSVRLALGLLATVAILVLTVVACSSSDSSSPDFTPTSSSGGTSTALSPPFSSCRSTSNCQSGNLCVDEGYCKPLCQTASECTSYPYANLGCHPVSGTASRVCDDHPTPTMFGGATSTGGSSSGGGSGGAATCQSGNYCAACNMCFPPGGCPYWCPTANGLAICGSSPALVGCAGAVHSGCDCAPGTSSGGNSSSGNASSGGSSGGSACQSANGCVSSYTMTGDCNGYIGLRNNCGKQVSCHYTLANGQQGCALPEPNSNSCGTNGIYAPGVPGGTINCEASDNFDCLNAIGCNL